MMTLPVPLTSFVGRNTELTALGETLACARPAKVVGVALAANEPAQLAEQGVVRLAAEGLSNPDIGSRLSMSHSPVRTHLSHVCAKLGVTNRTELALVVKRTCESGVTAVPFGVS